jgi:integrase
MMLLYVTTLAEAGLRCDSEALHLRWEDVDLEEGFLWIAKGAGMGTGTKSGKGRWVPMPPKLRQAMREHFARFRFVDLRRAADPVGVPPHHHAHTTTRRRAKVGQRSESCGAPSRTR